MSYGHQGKEQDSGIYTRYMIRMVRGAYALAQLAGHSRLAAAARRWIRARVGTWLTTALEGRSLMPSPAIRDAWRGPGALVARDPAHVTSLDSSITVPNAGPRSISTQNDGSMKLAIDSLAGVYLSEALGLPGRPSSLTAALRKRWPDRPELWDWCLSAEERELALRGLRGDDAALVDVVDRLAGSYPWRHEKTIGRNGGRSSFVVVHENASSSTAGTHLAQGRVIPGGLVEVECLTAQYGPRKSGKPENFDPNAYAVGPSVATIVGDTVRALRIDDKPYPLKKDGPSTMEHPEVSRRLFVHPDACTVLWSQGPDGLRLLRGPGAEPGPTPEPPPEEDPMSINTDPYCGFSPLTPGHGIQHQPGVPGSFHAWRRTTIGTAVWQKGRPWWTVETWVRHSGGWKGIGEERDKEGHRRFYRSRTELGDFLLPPSLPADGAELRWKNLFSILRTHWNDPVFVPGTWTPVLDADGNQKWARQDGELEQLVAYCGARYLGEIEVAGIGPVRAIQRVDYQSPKGDIWSTDPADWGAVEVYTFLEYYGLFRWERWIDGRKTDDTPARGGAVPVDAPFAFPGVGPDNRSGTVAVIGFAPEPPAPSAPSPFPTSRHIPERASPPEVRGGSTEPQPVPQPEPQPEPEPQPQIDLARLRGEIASLDSNVDAAFSHLQSAKFNIERIEKLIA